MIDIALRNFILNNTTISGYTSNVYPQRLPQNTTTASIVYSVYDGYPSVQVGSVSPISETNIQLDVYSPTYGECRNLTNELITIFNGYNGSLDTLEVSGSYCRNVINIYEEKLNLYRATIDINVHVK